MKSDGLSNSHIEQYELSSYVDVIQMEWCGAIAFNNDSSIVIAGCERDIKVFDFRDIKLIQKELLHGHKDTVKELLFKQDQQFISASNDKTIRIWSKQISGYINTITCYGQGEINCIQLQHEEFIISCSGPHIQFWDQNFQCTQIMTGHNPIVYSISLNKSQNQLISCGGKRIVITEQRNNVWRIRQKIQIHKLGTRICFVDDDFFCFQPWNSYMFQIYQINKNQLFQLYSTINVHQGVKCSFGFPIRYNKNNSIILSKNGQSLNIIKKWNNQFILIQTIKFQDTINQGAISDNGQQLITWDYRTKRFQIRKLVL